MGRKAITSPTSYVPPAPSKAKRNRPWDQEHKNVTAYRGIDPDVVEQVKSLAERMDVPVGEVVQALMEHGLADLEAGRLALHPRPRMGKFTLFGEK